MMYNEKLVASIKVKGKILREFKDKVYVPFGAEYSILLKNLNTVRAVVNIFIDGENAVPGGLVLNAGQSVDLERWVKNGNLQEGNCFKFIERTSAIENGPRGIKEEDGLVRIEYQFELPRPILNVLNVRNDPWNRSFGNPSTGDWIVPQGTVSTTSFNVGGVLRGADYSKGEQVKSMAATAIDNYCATNSIVSQSECHEGSATMDWCDAGITVPGSRSTQSFQTTTVGALDPTIHNIILHIVGDLGNNKPVEKPVTVKAKQQCETCGHTNKATANFCTKCGTSLKIYA